MTTDGRTVADGRLKRRFEKWRRPLLWVLVALAAAVVVCVLIFSTWLDQLLTIALVTATLTYAILTYGILKTTQEQARMAQHLVVGIHIDAVELSHPEWTPPAMGASPGDFVVFLTLHALGTGPALALAVEGEVSLRHVRLDDQSTARCKYSRIVDFLPSGEATGPEEVALVWEHRVADALLQDLNIAHGMFREETTQGGAPLRTATGDDSMRSHALREPKVTVHVVYRNNLRQDFESVLETHIGCGEEGSALEHRRSENLECVVHRTYAKPFISQSIASAKAADFRRSLRGILGTGPTLGDPELGSNERMLEGPPS